MRLNRAASFNGGGRCGRFLSALLGLGLAALAACGGGGCSAPAKGLSNNSRGGAGPGDGSPVILPAELDELTRAFADRYVGLLSSTCDALKQDNPDPVQRREAQDLLVACATNVYDIASNADAFTRMLDLVVVTTLVSQVWIDDDRAGEVFGDDRGEVLVRALHHGRVEAWALAAQVLRPDQLELLDYLMWDWRRQNPDMVRMASVRFSNFAIGRGKTAAADVLDAGGFFANVGDAGQAVDEARLLTERMFFMLKREGTLLRWQAEALKDAIVATPEVGQYVADTHRLTELAGRLPADVAAERQAIVAAFDERAGQVDATVAGVRQALAEADGVAAAVGEAGESLDAMLRTADGLLARYEHMSAASADHTARPFDVREYTEGVKELTAALGEMNALLKSSDALLASPEWERRIRQFNDSADGRLAVAADQSRLVMDDVFRRIFIALGVLFALLLLYRLAASALTRRDARAAAASARLEVGGDARTPGNGHPGRHESRAATDPDLTGAAAKGNGK